DRRRVVEDRTGEQRQLHQISGSRQRERQRALVARGRVAGVAGDRLAERLLREAAARLQAHAVVNSKGGDEACVVDPPLPRKRQEYCAGSGGSERRGNSLQSVLAGARSIPVNDGNSGELEGPGAPLNRSKPFAAAASSVSRYWQSGG